MRTIALASLGLLLWAAAGRAAEIFGTISEGGKPVPAGTAVKIDCGSGGTAGVTDQFGSYSLKSASPGDCRLTLTYKGSDASLNVTLYEKPSRYDLVVKQDGGKLEIARK